MFNQKRFIVLGIIITFILEIMFYIYITQESFLDTIIGNILTGIINLLIAFAYFVSLILKKDSIFRYQLLAVIMFLFMMGILISFKIYYIVFKEFDFFTVTSLILDIGIIVNPFKQILSNKLK